MDTVPKGQPSTPSKGKGAPSAQKTQVKQASSKAPPGKQGKKGKKSKHQVYDLIVTLDLVRHECSTVSEAKGLTSSIAILI